MSFGMLYYADILTLSDMPDYKIERIELRERSIYPWTYPEIQPILLKKADEFLNKNNPEK